MPRRPLIVAASLSLLILLARLAFPVPALSDATGASLPAGVHLTFPVLNLLFAPLFDLWDGVTLLAMPRLNAFLLGAVILGAAWSVVSSVAHGRLAWGQATLRLLLVILGLGAFVLGGIRWRRPMAHLAGVAGTTWVVDLHSHTNVSHDVKGWLQRDFDLNTSRAWHARGGFDAFFVTDHNRTDGWTAARIGDRTIAPPPVACPGEELSLWRAHIVVLGNTDSIPQSLYSDSAAGLARLFGESESRWGGVTLASIPEYDDNHFADLPEWIREGVDGFEISNAAPKANRQTVADRDSVIKLAEAGHRWLAGVTDQHGMGATVQTWTLITKSDLGANVPGFPFICGGILESLKEEQPGSVRVIERHRLRVDSGWPTFLTAIAVPWEGWRAAGLWQIVSWLAWIWGLAYVRMRRTRRTFA